MAVKADPGASRSDALGGSTRSTLTKAKSVSELTRRTLRYANRGLPRIDFLRKVSNALMESSDCDAVEFRLREPDLYYRWEASRHPKRRCRLEILPHAENGRATRERCVSPGQSDLERLCRDVLGGRIEPSLPFFTRQGSFWTSDTRKPLRLGRAASIVLGGLYRSLALIRFTVDDRRVGLLKLESLEAHHFTRHKVQSYEGFAQILGLAIANRRVQWAVRERVKELTCLYGIARVAQKPGSSMDEILQGIVELLPRAWQHPDIASARILVGRCAYTTPGFKEGPYRQAADILVNGTRGGTVEVFYTRKKMGFAEGPFLKEEQSLIDTVAREVSLTLERREAEEHKSNLQEQLRHADRLATIGQLAAGVAHELNEPLANILGFAQLANKASGLPATVASDLDRIVKTSLHARQIIQKLLVFARQMPLRRTQVNLNQIVEDGLHFLESQCAKAGIELVRSLTPGLPDISGDPSQLQQVLVNLVVNAVQASSTGGTLTIETHRGEDYVSFAVADTGSGMTEEVKRKIFTPFFTTKAADQGTGLGLAVVHGIVTSHQGRIQVDSQPGRGSRFEVQLSLSGSGPTANGA